MAIRTSFVGNVGQDADLRFVGDTPVLTLSVATEDREKIDGKWEKVTTWVRTTVWGKRGEELAKHITKGSRIFVVGKLSVRGYQDRDGRDRFSVECRADDIEFAGGGRREDGDNATSGGGNGGGGEQRAHGGGQHNGQRSAGSRPAARSNGGGGGGGSKSTTRAAPPPEDHGGGDGGSDYGGGSEDSDIPF